MRRTLHRLRLVLALAGDLARYAVRLAQHRATRPQEPYAR